MEQADKQQAEMIWEHLVQRIRELQTKVSADALAASAPDNQAAGKSGGKQTGKNGDSEWDVRW